MSSPQEMTSDSYHPMDAQALRRSYTSASAYAEEAAAIHSPSASHAVAHHEANHDANSAPSGSTELTNETAGRRTAARMVLSPIDTSLDLVRRGAEVLRLAIEVFPQTDNWVVFYREILGVDGVVRKLYKSVDDLRTWESTREFDEVQTMLSALRSHDTGKGDTIETQRMITVRLPMSLHEALKKESDEYDLSINKLCITKLLHKMDSRFVPQEPGKRRGRKPGPQGKRTVKTS